MKKTQIKIFLFSAGSLLFLTAAAKLISGFGSAKVLAVSDPLISIPYRYLFLAVGALELMVAAGCFFNKKDIFQAGVVAWLAAAITIYRVGLFFIDYHLPCSCLGVLTASLPVKPQTADWGMKIVLAYLTLGSGAVLAWHWLEQKRMARGKNAPLIGVGH